MQKKRKKVDKIWQSWDRADALFSKLLILSSELKVNGSITDTLSKKSKTVRRSAALSSVKRDSAAIEEQLIETFVRLGKELGIDTEAA